MALVMSKSLDTTPFADTDLWQLGLEENWEELKRILAPVTGKSFAATELKHRLLIDDIRRRFDSSKDDNGNTILNTILLTNAVDKRRMADVANLVLSVGVHPDLPDNDGRRPAHAVGVLALPELVETIFACRPDMLFSTPLKRASATQYVRSKSDHQFNPRSPLRLNTQS
jgi:hypothetical protein